MPYVDFQEIKRRVSIEDAAKLLNLTLKKSGNQLRGVCPACGNEDERILALTPSRNLFYCFDAKKGGDCIALVQHITGLDVQDAAAFLSPSGVAHTSPAPEQKKAAATKQVEFDPAKFAAKLTYSEEVEALGITEAQAQSVALGWHPQRKQLYFALRDEFGFTTGYVAVKGEMKMPPKLLQNPNVVKLKRA